MNKAGVVKDAFVVSASHIYKTYESNHVKTEVLKDISFTVERGEFVSVMGPSGCGKSTLLYLIGGLDAPTKGTLYTCGSKLYRLRDAKQSMVRRNRIGFVFQFYNLVPNLTVEENIILPALMAGKHVSEIRKRLRALLDMMNLSERRKEIPAHLSGGEQQRVSIARAVIANPMLVLADEPTGNLDSAAGEEVLNNFARINDELGVTIIMVTHSDQASGYANRIIHMKDGRIL